MSNRYELWQLWDYNRLETGQGEPEYQWMVYSVSGQKSRWFHNEELARQYLNSVIGGVRDRGDADDQ